MEHVLKTMIADFKLAEMVKVVTAYKFCSEGSCYKITDVKTWLASTQSNGLYKGTEYVNAMQFVERIYDAMVSVGIVWELADGYCKLSTKALDIIYQEEDTTMLIKLRNGETLFLDERDDKSVRIEYRNTAVEVF